ncbi:hypothetical protein [Sorangium sp. So ce1097]|uniref:hypothetical protein n=1 Tax=Sorangium sp. So ce1097 TaxID=3133330 RepID=UPI003F6059A6
MKTETLLSLHDKLREDHLRAERAFSEDMQLAAKLILKPYAYDHEVAEVLRQWCMRHQSCQFGRVAASRAQVYFCVLRERDLADGDARIRAKIAAAKRHWKQRAVTDTQTPPHSFVLVFATDRLMLAAPDENLRRFSTRLLELAGWAPLRRAKRGENPISSDFLYLQDPSTDAYYGFQFNVDFFAAAGDGRWWHDHRLPAGIGFTANSTGHMKSFLDWYRERGSDHGEWALKQAMLTIAQAHPTRPAGGGGPESEGRLTWLRDLDAAGRPLVQNIACPFKNPPKQLQGKDWTRYEGLIHTDHAVREEFFADRDGPITAGSPYLEDFTYLYDAAQPDFINFTSGKPFTEDEVFAELGGPDTWTRRTGDDEEDERSPEETAEIERLLAACRAWESQGIDVESDSQT